MASFGTENKTADDSRTTLSSMQFAARKMLDIYLEMIRFCAVEEISICNGYCKAN